MVRSSRLRLVLILLTAVLVALGGSVPTATASPPAPPETGSAAGHADSPMTVAPPPGPATRARAAAAPQAPPPDEMSEEAEADKAKAEAGFRSPNQKPIATELGTPARPAAAAQAAPAGPQTLATTFPGVTDTGFQPPDTIMAAGPNNVVMAVNAEVAVYSKVGTQLSVQSLADVFSSQGQAAQDGLFDPQVVYDRYIDRFWLTAISKHENPNRSSMLIAVSQTSDATDGWRTTAIDAGVTGNDATGNWCDRDSLGFDTQAIYVSCDMFAFPADSHVFKGAKIRVMTKGQFLAGPCCSWWDFANLGGVRDTFSIRPARMLGATVADGEYLVNATGGGGADDTLRVWHITNPANCCRDNPSAPDITFSFQQVGVFQPAPDVRQQGTSATLDPDGTRLQYAFWQGGHLSTGQNLACPDVNAACVAYTELDVTKYPDMSVVNDFVLNQSDSVDRFYPAVDANDAGDKAMVFSTSGPNRFAGTSFARIPRSTTCTNCANSETSIADGLGPYGASGKQRWGDYSGASVDPDGAGVWVYGEFASTGSHWGTEVGLTMDRTPTSITYTGPLGADAAATVDLSANVVEAAGTSPTPLAGAPVTFFVGTQVCSATTDATGRAVCPIKLDQPDGLVDVEAEYPGDPGRMPSSTTDRFAIGTAGRTAVTLTYTGATSGEFQTGTDLAATMVDPATGSGISGEQITFTLGSQSCVGMTDGNGRADCTVLLQQRPGGYTVTADFRGDTQLAPATASAPFTITKGHTVTTLTLAKDPTDFGQDVSFTATVAAANPGARAPTGPVEFKRGTIALGARAVDAAGSATLTVPLLQVGQNVITAAYAGDDFFLSSSAGTVQSITCSRILTGDQRGGLNLTAGSTCLVNATVSGRTTIGPGAAVSIRNSRLNGGITATDGLALTVCDSTVDGDVKVSGSTKFVLVGDAGDDDAPACGGNTLNGSTTITGSKGQAEVGGTTISKDLTVNDSSGRGPDEESEQSQIEANTIGGNLFCSGNTPDPSNDGQPNAITGGTFGQCFGF